MTSTSLFRWAASLAMCAGVGLAQNAPVIVSGGVMNAADYGQEFAPGALFTVVGRNLAPGFAGAPGFPLPTVLQGTSVEVLNGDKVTPAPLYMVSAEQINAMLPYDLPADVQLRVRTAAGVSGTATIHVGKAAPRMFTVDQTGFGRAVVTDASGGYLTRKQAAKPGQTILFYGTGFGAVTPAIAAGMGANDGSAGAPLNRVAAATTVQINGASGRVDFAGLCPYFSGLYQLNVRMPYWNVIGDSPVTVKVGETTSTQEISIPVEPNGFYWVLSAGKFPNGQTMRALKGANSAVAHIHNDAAVFTNEGFRVWTKEVDRGQFGPVDFSPLSGLAFTLKNGSQIVYDNNGIENRTSGDYYDNKGGDRDQLKASMWTYASMTKNVDSVFAGYVRLTARTTFDQIIGYFDGNGNTQLLFDANNVYNRYRMNIWSNARNNMPTATNSFEGDVFTTEPTSTKFRAGKFSVSKADVSRVYQDGTLDPNFRLVYTLEQPMTLEPGEYWFSHDLSLTAEAEADLRAASTKATKSRAAMVDAPSPVKPSGAAEVSR